MLAVPSLGTQPGGLAAGEPASQALSPVGGGWRSAKASRPGKLRLEPGTELFGHVHTEAFLSYTGSEKQKLRGLMNFRPQPAVLSGLCFLKY